MHMNTIFRRLKAGFTLTELMAVVIIVAILAAVAAGSYKKAIERSHFSEGLVAANTVLAAVERYYADSCNEGSCVTRPQIKYLDVALANQKNCTTNTAYCTKTKYFEISIDSSGFVDAKRMKGSKSGDYTIRVYPETFGSFTRTDTRCIFSNTAGKDLCISVGYGTCSASACYK